MFDKDARLTMSFQPDPSDYSETKKTVESLDPSDADAMDYTVPDADHTALLPPSISNAPIPPPAERAIRSRRFEPTGARAGLIVPALLIIAVGALLLINPPELDSLLRTALILAGIAVACLIQFLLSGGRVRGLGFIGLLGLALLGVVALFVSGRVNAEQGWPLLIVAPGLALLVLFVIGVPHERGVLLTSLILLWAGGIALSFTFAFFTIEPFRALAPLWPIALVIPIVALLSRLIRVER